MFQVSQSPAAVAVLAFALPAIAPGASVAAEARLNDLQSIVDSCRAGSVCALPAGEFTISHPIVVRKSIDLAGAGKPRAGRGKSTGIRVTDEIPALRIEGSVHVQVRDLGLVGGGIQVGGDDDPCRGIDDPFGVPRADLVLSNLSIDVSAHDAIRFSGGTLRVKSVTTTNGDKNGIYVASAMGDVVLVDLTEHGNAGWGVFVCNLRGSGLIFMNGLRLFGNGLGGLGIVGRGGPAPESRPACIQNSTMDVNGRFGALLYDVAPETLLFNSTASANLAGEDGFFGDGYAIANSENVALWDVTAAFNARAGYSAFGISKPTRLSFFGVLEALGNAINLNAEGDSVFADTQSPLWIAGCGSQFLAPATDPHCTDAEGVDQFCQVLTSGLTPPEPQP